jgi:hypothetical protein
MGTKREIRPYVAKAATIHSTRLLAMMPTGITLVNAKLGQTCPEIIDAGVDFFTGHPFVNAVFVIGP